MQDCGLECRIAFVGQSVWGYGILLGTVVEFWIVGVDEKIRRDEATEMKV